MTVKKALLRGFIGMPMGVFIAYTITVLLSLFYGQGFYGAAVPAFISAVGTESGAVALQYLLSALMGFVFALASCIWKIERWSLTLQTVSHFLLVTLGMLPIVWLCHWADYIPGGLWGYFGIFAAIYAVLWVILTCTARRQVHKVNRKLRER